MSYLDGWAGVIQRQADESAKREEKRLAEVKAGAKKIIPETMKNEELLAMYDHCVGSSGDHNPKVGKEFRKVSGKLRAEIRSRMKDK